MPYYIPQNVEDFLGLAEIDRDSGQGRHNLCLDAHGWKSSAALEIEVNNFCRVYGLDHVALLTLILEARQGGCLVSPEEAQVALRNAMRHLLPKLFQAYIVVMDYHRSGQIHFHILVACFAHIRHGWNWTVDEQQRELQQKVKKENRRMTTAERALSRKLAKRLTTSRETLALWMRLRDGLPACGFRKNYPCELKPVRNPPGLARYLARRYRESRAASHLRPKRSQCVRYSHSYKRCVDKKLRFSLVGPSATVYRLKKAAVGAALGICDIEEMVQVHGARWEHDYRHILRPTNRATPDGFFSWQQEALAALRNLHASPLCPVAKNVLTDLLDAAARRQSQHQARF